MRATSHRSPAEGQREARRTQGPLCYNLGKPPQSGADAPGRFTRSLIMCYCISGRVQKILDPVWEFPDTSSLRPTHHFAQTDSVFTSQEHALFKKYKNQAKVDDIKAFWVSAALIERFRTHRHFSLKEAHASIRSDTCAIAHGRRCLPRSFKSGSTDAPGPMSG